MALEVGSIVEGKVTGITKFGAFIELAPGKTGMVHISEVAPTYVKEIRDHLTENQQVKVKILAINDDGKINLSIKKAVEQPPRRNNYNSANKRPGPGPDVNFSRQNQAPMSFEDMMAKFKQNSDDKMLDIKRNLDGKRGTNGKRHTR